MTIADWTGSVGVFIVLIAFFLNILDRMKSDSLGYLLLNTLGGGISCLASVFLHYWPFILLEGCWTVVSLYGLLKVLRAR